MITPSNALSELAFQAFRDVSHLLRPAHLESPGRLSRWTEAVEVAENEETQIPVHIARKFKPEIQLGEFIVDPLPPIDFGRIAAQTAKQVIVQKVRDAERERQYDEYKDRIGEIVHGTVKRVEFGSVVVDFGRAEGVVRRDEMIPRDDLALTGSGGETP